MTTSATPSKKRKQSEARSTDTNTPSDENAMLHKELHDKKRRRLDNKSSVKTVATPILKKKTIEDILSPELRKNITDGDDSNAVLILEKKKKKKAVTPPPPPSKKTVRKMKKLAEKKQKNAERGILLESLDKHSMPQDQLKLFRPIRSLGQGKETTKQKLQRTMAVESANVSSTTKESMKKLIEDENTNKFWARKSSDWDDSLLEQEVPAVPEVVVEEPKVVPKKAKVPTETPSKEKTFLTLDFGFGTTSTAASKPVVAEKAQVVESIEDINLDEEPNELDMADSDDEEPTTWREKVLKGFSELIDDVEARLANDEKNRIAILDRINALLDITVQDDSSDEDSDEEVDGNAVVDLRRTILDDDDAELEELRKKNADVTIIKGLLTDLDDTRTEEQKQFKYTKYFVSVSRTPEIEDQRINLPVVAEEQSIMESIDENDIVLLCGETGSGKTTQLPQFLYEAGYGRVESGHPGLIGVTQPRRVAAVSTAKRVSDELNMAFNDGTGAVAYQVRYDNNVNENTVIKFMTDGVLIREIQEDPLLLKYSVIVLDEAHERNVNTDILIGWLSRFIPQRNKMARNGEKAPNDVTIYPLKLIIMSATLRVDDFILNHSLFNVNNDPMKTLPPTPPVIEIKSRQFPVSVHFNKRTEFGDYVDACYKKIIKIHEKLPQGSILVFLTGKQEIDFLVAKLNQYTKDVEKRKQRQEQILADKPVDKDADKEEEFINQMADLEDDNGDDEEMDDEEGASLVTLFEDNITDEKVKEQGRKSLKKLNSTVATKLTPLPLYSMLSPSDQLRVFEPAAVGTRLCVISTNVAETSLTIPGVRYVLDTGRVKEKVFDRTTGVSKFIIGWTSQASANQRAGRAGRTGPGHCYRLYSSAIFDQQFQKFTDPDILRTPVDGVVLQMKSLGIGDVAKFPFPTPPDRSGLESAVRSLTHIGALSVPKLIKINTGRCRRL